MKRRPILRLTAYPPARRSRRYYAEMEHADQELKIKLNKERAAAAPAGSTGTQPATQTDNAGAKKNG